MTKSFTLKDGCAEYSFTNNGAVNMNGKNLVKWTMRSTVWDEERNGYWEASKWQCFSSRATRKEIAEAFGVKPRQVIINVNEKLGNTVGFSSMAQYRKAIKACGYALPADGLQEGRDYECILEDDY